MSLKKSTVMTSGMPTSPSAVTGSIASTPSSKETSGNVNTVISKPQSPAPGQKSLNDISVPTSPKKKMKQINDTGEELLLLSDPHVQMIYHALDSIACDENGVSQGNDNSVNRNADCESQVTLKWLGLENVHIMTEEEINSHNKYIDNLIAMEIENEKMEMLLYLDKLL